MGGMLLARRLRRKFISNVHEKSCNQNQRNCNLSDSICSPKVVHFSNSFSNQTVNSKNIVPNMIFIVNIAKSKISFGKLIFGPINGTAYSAAEKLIDNPESAFNQGLAKRSRIRFTVTGQNMHVNFSIG